jgi:hypothetical protein
MKRILCVTVLAIMIFSAPNSWSQGSKTVAPSKVLQPSKVPPKVVPKDLEPIKVIEPSYNIQPGIIVLKHKTLDEPLARPKYLTVIQTEDPATLLRTIVDTVRKAGFQIGQMDVKEQQFEATKNDTASSKNYDRVIVWLERDVQEPAKYVKVYFLYGRYEEIMAEKMKISRVELFPHEEEEHIGKLKQEILALSIP